MAAVLTAESDGLGQWFDSAIVVGGSVPVPGCLEQDLTALVGVVVEVGFGSAASAAAGRVLSTAL